MCKWNSSIKFSSSNDKAIFPPPSHNAYKQPNSERIILNMAEKSGPPQGDCPMAKTLQPICLKASAVVDALAAGEAKKTVLDGLSFNR